LRAERIKVMVKRLALIRGVQKHAKTVLVALDVA